MLHQIGVGALGPVFRTYEPERDRLVAVKAFRLDITPEQAQALAEELSRAAEAGLFHPSIVEPIAAGVEGTVAYRAEEYVAAESLDVAMRQYAPAPIATVLPFITQLAGAIDFARAAGVGHGALHPRDIFVTPEEARATGFGVVEALERVGLRAPVRRPYSPPERIAGAAWTTPADVFSLAAITYELADGPETGRPRARDRHAHGRHAERLDGFPARGAGARHGSRTVRRFATALAFASALEAAARGDASDATLPMAPPVGATVAPARVADAAPDHRQRALPARSAEGKQLEGEEDDLSRRSDAKRRRRRSDDIAAEQLDDEADHQLRLSEREDVFRRDPGLPLDEDIEAEAEADRFVGDDFLLDAAGAVSAAPLQPHDRRARELPIDADPADTLVDVPRPRRRRSGRGGCDLAAVRAAGFLNEETIRRPERDAVPYPSIPVPAQSLSHEEVTVPERSPFRAVALLIAGIAVGLIGGYAIWGRERRRRWRPPARPQRAGRPRGPRRRRAASSASKP